MRRPILAAGLALALTGCPEDRLRPTLPPDVLVDTYTQQSASRVDVLWVVDDSESMEEEQENLAKNFQSFIELFTRGSIDYRIAVTTTDANGDEGRFHGTPKILSPQTGNVVTAFGNNIRVGIDGSSFEQGLLAAELALTRERQQNQPKLDQIEQCKEACQDALCIQECPNKYPVEFLRPDAYLYLIFVSDEEDKSDGEVRYFWRAFETANGVGNDGTVTAAAIVGTQENDCSATWGTRYLDLVALTGGETGSICDETFASTLRKLATSAVGLKRKFALTQKPNPETIEVLLRYPCNTRAEVLEACASVDDALCEGEPAEAVVLECTPKAGAPDGWTWEPATNVIFFDGESAPGLNAQIDIQYYKEGDGP